MFKDGTLLASYQGSVVAAEWQAITIEYPPSGPQPQGRYVLLQQNKNQILEVRSIVASFEGKAQNFIRPICIYDKIPTLSFYEYAVIINVYNITLFQLQKTARHQVHMFPTTTTMLVNKFPVFFLPITCKKGCVMITFKFI